MYEIAIGALQDLEICSIVLVVCEFQQAIIASLELPGFYGTFAVRSKIVLESELGANLGLRTNYEN